MSFQTAEEGGHSRSRPLLRPVVHGFVRGISGAVASFPEGADGLRLWLAAEDEMQQLLVAHDRSVT